MKRRITAGGYTVIEVLIVLGVTTMLLAAAILSFRGKISTTQLSLAVRDLESKIQSVVNDSQSGYYPNNGLTCSIVGGKPQAFPSGSATPGANDDCMFLGKIIGFTNGTSINILTVLGARKVQSGANVGLDSADLTEANPAVSNAANPETYSYQFGLTGAAIYDNSNPTTAAPSYGAIAFLAQLGGAANSGSPLTGSKEVLIYGVHGTTLASTAAQVSGQVSPANLVPLPRGARICLTYEGNSKKAEITVGSSGDQLNTNVLIDNGVGSEC